MASQACRAGKQMCTAEEGARLLWLAQHEQRARLHGSGKHQHCQQQCLQAAGHTARLFGNLRA